MKKFYLFLIAFVFFSGIRAWSVEYNYCFFEEPTYLRIDQQNSNSSSVFKIRFGSASGAIGCFGKVTLADATDIRGSFSFNDNKVSNSSNYNYTIAQKTSNGYYYAEPMYGTITIQYTGRTDGTYPIYRVTLEGTVDSYTPAYGSKGKLYANWSGELPVRFYNFSGNLTTLKNQTTITAKANDDSYGTVSGGGIYNIVGQSVTLKANATPGYIFSSWADNGSSNPIRTITIGNADATYIANFKVPSAGTIIGAASPTAGGIVEITPSDNQTGGTIVTLTASSNSGYSFLQWSDGNIDNPRKVYVDGDKTYTAVFVETLDLHFDWQTDNLSSIGDILGTGSYYFFFKTTNYGSDVMQITLNKGYVANGEYNMSQPAVTLYLTYEDLYDYGSVELPQPATYTVQTSANNVDVNQIVDFGNITRKQSDGTYYNFFAYYPDKDDVAYTAAYYGSSSLNSKVWYRSINSGSSNFQSGFVNIKPGAGEYPFIEGVLKVADGTYIHLTIGTSCSSGVITTSVNNTEYGDVTGVVLDDYSEFESGIQYEGGSLIELCARPKRGYIFKQWSDGVTMPVREVPVCGDASYFAEFVPADFVFYFASENITINRTNPDEYLYQFVINDGTKNGASGGYDSDILTLAFGLRDEDMQSYANVNDAPLEGFYGGTFPELMCAEIAAPYWSQWWEFDVPQQIYYSGETETCSCTLSSGKEVSASEEYGKNESTEPFCYFHYNGTNLVYWTTESSYCWIEEGSNGNIYIEQYIKLTSGQTIQFIVGEPKVIEEQEMTYTLTWDFNGGVTTSADGDYTNGANITEGEFIVAPAAPTREGYTFAGWMSDYTNEIETPAEETNKMPTPMPAQDVTYTAQWTANTYTVHFDKNNDFYTADGAITGEMEDQLFTYDAEDVALTANAYEWAGHTFQGWATAADGEKVYEDGEAVSNLTAEQNGEVVLYAVWDINEYTITFQDAETDGGYVWGSDDFAYGTVPAYNGEPMPSKEADEQYTYQFAGWKDAAGIEYPIGTDLLSVEGEATYYAVYTATKVPYELVWEVNGGDELTGDYTQGTVEWGTDIIAPATPTREGYTFTGWMNGNTNEIETPAEEINVMPTAMPAEGLTYTAQWTANTYTVRFDYSGDYYQVAGAITGEMEDQLFTYDAEDVALTVNAYEWAGHTFQGWATAADGEKVYEDGEAVSNLTSQQNGVVTLYAVWKTNNYTITFQDAEADGGHVWGSDDFAYGTVPAYNGEPMPSKEADEQYTYQFAGWKDAAGIKYPIGTDLPAVEGETTYYAVYIPTKVSYELVWDVNGGDELTGDYTQGTVEWGTEIVAPAAPTREGYTFTGWMNGNTNEIELPAEETNIMPFAMPVDGLTYAAQWEANVYYVRFFDNGEYYNAAGTIEGTMPDQTFYYDEGQYLQANAFTWEGHTFQGWATTADGEVVYGDVEDITDNLTSVKDAVIELYAVWTTDTYTITFKNSMGDDDRVWWSGELAYGTIPVYEGETPVKAADADYTYTFAGWMVNLEEQYPIGTDLPKVTEDATYLAMYTQEKTQFAVRFVNPDGSELQRYELPIGAVPAYDGVPTQANEGDEYNYYVFTFTGWIDDANNSYGASATLPAVTGEITYMAQYSKQLFINLQEQMDDDYYTDFSDKYNGERATTATLVRKFDQGKWATLCLPFNVNAAVLTSSGLKSRIYEFKYTKGDAENGFTLYFAQANKLDAGKGYIVNANAVLAQKTQFVFPNVVVNTNADIQSGFDITTLEGYNSQGNIYLVGTLRQGKVLGDDGSGIYYMGLSSNKIKLANSTTGTVVRAYRGIFRSTERIQVSRVRIVAESEDGEIVDELEVVDGEMKEASAPYKYVQDGILYIVRDGVRYTAEGQRID